MSDSPPAPPQVDTRGPSVRLVFLLWTGIGLFHGMRAYVNFALFGGPRNPNPVWIAGNLADGWYWALLTFPIFWVALRFRFTRRAWPLAVVVHAAGAVAAALGNILFNLAMARVLSPGDPGQFESYFRTTFFTDFEWYLLLVGAAYTVDYYRRLRAREVHAARLDESLAAARLEALKMQIQPHFLFNTLHTISELVHEDPYAAERMIVRLADLLRLTVDNAQTHEVTLAQEVEFLEAYLEIQRTRFQDRLQVEVAMGPGTAGARVPNLVLQPLVENAIRHGAASLGGLGRISVKSERRGERLRMEVHDNGPGPHPDPRPGGRQGVGVRNTRERLEQMYGQGGRLELTHCPVGGTIAAVEIPFSLAAETPPAGAAHTPEVLA
ncbi:MAG TPA: histidine kinase [Longimicrobium sp.]|nr:histidine kinase [Longimicrobium sp.]